MKLLAGEQGLHALCQVVQPYGGKAIFGKANSGKTLLSELVTSLLMMNEERQNGVYAPYSSEVVTAALRSWFGGSFFPALADSAFVSRASLEHWCQSLITELNLSSVANISTICALGNPSVWDTFTKRVRLLDMGADSLGNGSDVSQNRGYTGSGVRTVVQNGEIIGYCTPIVDFENSGASIGLILFFEDFTEEAWNKATITTTDVLLNSLDEDGNLLERSTRLTPVDDIDIFDIFEGYSVLQDSSSEGGFTMRLNLNSFEIDEAVARSKIAQRLNDYAVFDLCLTSNGLGFLNFSSDSELIKEGEFTRADATAFAYANGFREASRKVREPSDDKDVSKLDASVLSLAESDPIEYFSLLVNCGLVSEVVSASPTRAAMVGAALRQLFLSAGGSDKPILVMTEKKAWNHYGAVANNISIEDKQVRLTIRFRSGNLSYNASTSLLAAATGGMLLNPVVHVSTLDLTMVHDLSVRSATQSGGLDSSILGITQYLANQAVENKAHAIIETRDDFSAKSQNEDTARLQARSTLGANSTVAIHIERFSDTTRDVWVRFKGGDEYQDEELELPGLDLKSKSAPQNLLRSEDEVIKSIFEIVDVIKRKD